MVHRGPLDQPQASERCPQGSDRAAAEVAQLGDQARPGPATTADGRQRRHLVRTRPRSGGGRPRVATFQTQTGNATRTDQN